MIVLGLDLEATGLDKVKDRPIEAALSLWSTKYNRSVASQSILIQSDGVPIPAEVTEITGIHQSMVTTFGYEPAEAFETVTYYAEQAQAIVAFNGRRFDIPMCKAWGNRVQQAFPDKILIDPFTDLPMRGQELITMCAKKNIYYSAHEAGADVAAMLQLMSKFNFDEVLSRAQSPVLIVQSAQKRNENDKAKRHKFRWNPDEKIWWKAIKQMDLDALVKEVNGEFGLNVREDLTLEDLETE